MLTTVVEEASPADGLHAGRDIEAVLAYNDADAEQRTARYWRMSVTSAGS